MYISKTTIVRALAAAAVTATLIFAAAAPLGPPGIGRSAVVNMAK